MLYILDGVEIQYRECQILRDTAKGILEEKNKKDKLSEHKNEWISQLKCLAEQKIEKKHEICSSFSHCITETSGGYI